MAPLKRTPVRKKRTKPRPGRLKGKDLEKLRRDCFERDGYRCQHMLKYEDGTDMARCGWIVTWETGHMAHVRNRRMWGDNLENVTTKCATCHLIREHHEGNGGKIVPRKPGGADYGV